MVWRCVLAGLGHLGEPEVRAVGKYRRQQRALIIVGFKSGQIGEARQEPGLLNNIVEEVGDPHMGHQRIDPGPALKVIASSNAGANLHKVTLRSAACTSRSYSTKSLIALT